MNFLSTNHSFSFILKSKLILFCQVTNLSLFMASCSLPVLGSTLCCLPAPRWSTGESMDLSLTAPPAVSTGTCPISTPQHALTLWRCSFSATSFHAALLLHPTQAFWSLYKHPGRPWSSMHPDRHTGTASRQYLLRWDRNLGSKKCFPVPAYSFYLISSFSSDISQPVLGVSHFAFHKEFT